MRALLITSYDRSIVADFDIFQLDFNLSRLWCLSGEPAPSSCFDSDYFVLFILSSVVVTTTDYVPWFRSGDGFEIIRLDQVVNAPCFIPIY